MYDKASYQLLSLAEVAVGFALGFSPKPIRMRRTPLGSNYSIYSF